MKILVADDDFIAQKMIRKILEDLGHDVLVADDGLCAWEIIQTEKVRMVITDWMMPIMDGLELCRTIRENQTDGYIFIFMLTTINESSGIIKGLEAGADDYLTKPFSRAEFAARLKTGLRILDLESSLQKANEKVLRLSLTDPLTECYNKRYLFDQLPKEIRKIRRCPRPLSIIMCDIDHFKRVNDTYGHPTGDRVLKEFSRRISASIREDFDWLARFGGEEFLVVLPETPMDEAVILGERLRCRIAETLFDMEGTFLSITASFGITGVEATDQNATLSAEDLIKMADGLLYRSKRDGRDRITGERLNFTHLGLK